METIAAERGRPSPRRVVAFCTPELGHFQRLRPLIAGLRGEGLDVHVFTHSDFREGVERSGGVFVDLFGPWPIAAADSISIPIPVRYVTHAAAFADPIAARAAELDPELVIHGSFAVIGQVVARRLGLPRVHVCAGHQLVPAHFVSRLERDPGLVISPECRAAVATLRAREGIADASPFSYLTGFSDELNLYCEPPEFLAAEHRQTFAPLGFYGSLPEEAELERRAVAPSPFGDDAAGALKIYLSLGTVAWRYDAALALRTLRELAGALAGRAGVRALISLGRAALPAGEVAALAASNVRVERYVDQWAVLQEADLFVTHHGLNSTHEAIFHRVPMLSYPFFWDQPGLARICQRLGLALPLVDELRGAVTGTDLDAALARFATARSTMRTALERARAAELATLEARPALHRRIARLGARVARV